MFLRLVFLVFVLGITFGLGYYLGLSKNPAQHNQVVVNETLFNDKSNINHRKSEGLKLDSSKTVLTEALPPILTTQSSTLAPNAAVRDVVDLFTELNELQNNATNYQLYGQKIDEIRDLLSNSATEIAILSNYFETLPNDSNESYLIVSILQGLPDKKGHETLSKLATQSLSYSNEEGNKRFLDIVGRTGITNDEITDGLKQLALFSPTEEQKLYALDMLMPFQLTQAENQTILDRLEEMQEQASEESRLNYFIGQRLRFSDSEERTELAISTLSDENANIASKSVVLDYIEMGQVSKTPQTRELLFNLANQQGHPLQRNAVKVLVSSFDINQEEYKQLLDIEGIEPLSLR